jgi:hypothetical protein
VLLVSEDSAHVEGDAAVLPTDSVLILG